MPLIFHQDISGEGLGDASEHAPGLFYLLEKRGPGQIGTRRGAELFLLALLRLVSRLSVSHPSLLHYN
jgi:hypothetical protein